MLGREEHDGRASSDAPQISKGLRGSKVSERERPWIPGTENDHADFIQQPELKHFPLTVWTVANVVVGAAAEATWRRAAAAVAVVPSVVIGV